MKEIRLDSLTTPEEKMFFIMVDNIYGGKIVDQKAIKEVLITYEFTNYEDINDYMAGTRDRVGLASNSDYALLCELNTFYSDRIKEVNRRLVSSAWNNPSIKQTIPTIFRRLNKEAQIRDSQDALNRLQVSKLGLTEGIIDKLGKILKQRNNREYSSDEVKKIIRGYEGITGGLIANKSTSEKPGTQAFYGLLRSQRERTLKALQIVTGKLVAPEKTFLGEIDLEEVLNAETSIRDGTYDDEQFASYTTQKFIDIFDEEKSKINKELSKFTTVLGNKREVLNGYITKSKESANARMVGGVCVCGDNPDKDKKFNMWDMPNYFQLVLQDPDSLRCQGLVLLHHFEEKGKKVLTAALDPSSTYIYSVDEESLFKGLFNTLSQFAQDNNFDIIATSKNKTIRTNRTGGQFEKTIDKKVSEVNKTFDFSRTKTFSYHPRYNIKKMDIIWEKPVK